jgi:putative serine protease PepD
MKSNTANRFWSMLAILMIAALSCNLPQSGSAPSPAVTQSTLEAQGDPNDGSLSQAERTHLISATVKIDILYKKDGKLDSIGTGSGTILSKSGMILTNAHVAAPAARGGSANPDALAIGIVKSEDKPPVYSYLAELKAADGYLDLAVIQIISTMDGTKIDPNSLDLPYVEIGEPGNVHVGDGLFVFGFPGIGGDTITFTQGLVSGFASDEQVGDRAWMKTDATIAGGNSGGLAADGGGHIIGIPTSLGAVGSGMDCRPHQDTNGDGQLNDNDICVPVANFIADVRPINFAQPLIQAAQSGTEYTSPYRIPGVAYEDGTGKEEFSGFAWMDTSNASQGNCDTTGSVIDAYPQETFCIVISFNYSGMTDGESLGEVWYFNGEKLAEFTSVWGNGEKSQNPIWTPLYSINGLMQPGTYYVEFYAGKDLHKIGTTPEIKVGTSGFTLYGVIADSATGKPIPEAYIYVITGTYKQWQSKNFPKESIVANGISDKSGKYQVESIPLNEPYTYIVVADNYNVYYEDDVLFDETTPAQVEVNIELSK